MRTGVCSPSRAKPPDHRQSVELRQHAVDDKHVVIAFARQRMAVLAVGRMIGDVPRFPQRPDEIGGGVSVVLDEQNAHLCFIH